MTEPLVRIHAVAGVRETWSAVVFAWGLVGIRKKLLGVFLLCGMPSARCARVPLWERTPSPIPLLATLIIPIQLRSLSPSGIEELHYPLIPITKLSYLPISCISQEQTK